MSDLEWHENKLRRRMEVAAPQMLAALEEIRKRCDGRLGPDRATAVNEIADMADAAIKAATNG
jgi:hypothetical protein